MIEIGESLRLPAAAALIGLAVAVLPFFYGMPTNAIVFLVGVLFVLGAATTVGSARLAVGFLEHPWSSGIAVFALSMLAMNYQWSLSKDSSFAPLWSLALLPTTYLVVAELSHLRWRVYSAFVLIVLAFCVLSLWMLFRSGIPAALPLTDPNNFASLLYLALIPSTYVYLRRFWSGRIGRLQHVFALIAFAILTATLFATQSRVALVILWVAIATFLAVGVTRRQRIWPILIMAALALTTAPIVQMPLETEKSFAGDELSRGTGVRAALNRAAFEIFLEHPVTGAGVNVFPLIYRQTRPLADQDTAGLSVHNDYLQLLAEGGPLLVLPLLLFAAAVGLRFARTLVSCEVPGSEFGAITALGAVLAHALVNFVVMTGVLAVVIGIAAALVPWGTPVPANTGVRLRLRWGVRLLFVWGWLAFLYLLLDVFSLGVYQRQPGIPFADRYSRNVDSMLDYSRFAQSLNANRGIPVLAEAAIRQVQLEAAPESEYLQNLTLHTFRRAILTDPWNSHALMQMHDFVTRHPEISDRLTAEEQPEQLLLRSLALDPMFIRALDALRTRAEARGEGEIAYRVAREHVGKWLELLSYSTPEEAQRWHSYLLDWAVRTKDPEYVAELDAVAGRMERIGQNVRLRLWFN